MPGIVCSPGSRNCGVSPLRSRRNGCPATNSAPGPPRCRSLQRRRPKSLRSRFPFRIGLQEKALEALRQSRKDGRGRALVLLATGLGKTWLAAFDAAAIAEQQGRFPRVLFVAHRSEILEQAAATFGRMARHLGETPRISWLVGSDGDLEGDLVFASVQKLSRPEHLAKLDENSFDYVVVDEVHHATADSYRRILARVRSAFVLGLTATPDRADDADVRGLFDDHVAFEADLGAGVEQGLLCPFQYWGVKDTVDYENIPWRNTRFDLEALTEAAATEARMARLWEAWQGHAGSRSLVFCCSVRHASFVHAWLAEQGRSVRRRHRRDCDAGETSRPREPSTGRPRRHLRGRPLQRGGRPPGRRQGRHAPADRVSGPLPPAARAWPPQGRGKEPPHGHRLRREPSRVPRSGPPPAFSWTQASSRSAGSSPGARHPSFRQAVPWTSSWRPWTSSGSSCLRARTR